MERQFGEGNQDVGPFTTKAPDARKRVIRGRKGQITPTIAADLLANVDEIAIRMGQRRAALINWAIYELAERVVS